MNKDLKIKKIENMLPPSQYSPVKKEIKTHFPKITIKINNKIINNHENSPISGSGFTPKNKIKLPKIKK